MIARIWHSKGKLMTKKADKDNTTHNRVIHFKCLRYEYLNGSQNYLKVISIVDKTLNWIFVRHLEI